MEYTIAHETAYAYTEPVQESYTLLHLRPRSDEHQFCSKYELRIAPVARVFAYSDRFANEVEHFHILRSHDRLSITTHSQIVTLLPAEPVPPALVTPYSVPPASRISVARALAPSLPPVKA